MPLDRNADSSNMGKLSIALLEHLVEPILGQDAIKILKEPVLQEELWRALASAFERVESKFRKKKAFLVVAPSLLDLHIEESDALRNAILQFYELPTDTSLQELLVEKINSTRLTANSTEVRNAIAYYLALLRAELTVSAPDNDFREKLQTIYQQSMQADLMQINRNTSKLADLLQQSVEGTGNDFHLSEQVNDKVIIKYQPTESVFYIFVPANRELTQNEKKSIYIVVKSMNKLLMPSESIRILPVSQSKQYENQYDFLRSWLNRLADAEFRDLIRSLLTADELTDLPVSSYIINRGDFLGHLQQIRRLQDVEDFLARKFTTRRPTTI